MPNYLVISHYTERQMSLDSTFQTAETPLDAAIQDCCQQCNLDEAGACQVLETETYELFAHQLPDHVKPEDVPSINWQKIGWPWHEARERQQRIKQLGEALETVEKLDILRTVEGSGFAAGLNAEAVRDEMRNLEREAEEIRDAWEKRKIKVTDRRERSVVVDPPQTTQETTNGGDDDIPF